MNQENSALKLQKISTIESRDVVIVSRGLGSIGKPHNALTQFLENQGMEVHFAERNGDILLSTQQNALDTYIQYLSASVEELLGKGKNVHLFGTSFGAFLSGRYAEEVGEKVRSLVMIAPMIDPYPTVSERTLGSHSNRITQVKLSSEAIFLILQENIDSLQGQGLRHVEVPSLVIWGDQDRFEKLEVIAKSLGTHSIQRIIPGVGHQETLKQEETWNSIHAFYKEQVEHGSNLPHY